MNNENFDLELNNDVENFNLTPNDEDEEFTVEFGEVFNDGGTHDYNELDNKPQINGNTLEGNKTNKQLGIPVYTEGTGITLSGNTISADTGVLATKADLNNKQNVIADLSQIRSGASAGATAVQPEDLARIATTGSYNDSLDKPSINNVTLTGNKSLDALGIQPKGDYALESEIPDVSNFITNTVDNLVNYYKKSETFNKQEVNDLISAITTMDVRVVQTLPTEDISTTTIYLVPKTTAGANDAYDEYIYVSNAWEHIGSTEVDLTNYVTNTDYATSSVGGVVKSSANYGSQVASSGIFYGSTRTYEQYSDGNSNVLICKGTLENVITGKGLVSNTDYATATTGGVVKTSATSGTQMSVNGVILGVTKTNQQYDDSSEYLIINKGTLENVITGKGLVDQTALATKQDTLTAGTGINITNNVISATGGGGGGVGNNVFYGTCATGTSTAAKVVVCEDFTASELVAGTRLTVLFTNANSYNGTATLNVNNTGAKDIYYNGTTTNARYMWVAGESVEFVYNGEQWATVNGGLATTTYYGVTKLTSSASSDSQSVALTPRSLYYLANYSIAPFYSSSSTYAVGDKVRYSYYIYECITAIETPEEWTAAHWKAIDPLQTQIDALEARIRALENS